MPTIPKNSLVHPLPALQVRDTTKPIAMKRINTDKRHRNSFYEQARRDMQEVSRRGLAWKP